VNLVLKWVIYGPSTLHLGASTLPRLEVVPTTYYINFFDTSITCYFPKSKLLGIEYNEYNDYGLSSQPDFSSLLLPNLSFPWPLLAIPTLGRLSSIYLR